MSSIPETILMIGRVFYRKPKPLTVLEGRRLMMRIQKGDTTVLTGLTCSDDEELLCYTNLPRLIIESEWGLAAALPGGVDSEAVLVAGGPASTNWKDIAPPLIALGHTHPMHDKGGIARSRHIMEGGVRFDDINGKSGDQNEAERFRVFPSVEDVIFCANYKLPFHSVQTPYAVVEDQGAIWIANPAGTITRGNANIPIPTAARRLKFIIFDAAFDGKTGASCDLTAYCGPFAMWEKKGVRVESDYEKGKGFTLS